MTDTPPTNDPPPENPPGEEGESDGEESSSETKDTKDWQAEARRKGKENSSLRARLKDAEAAAEAAKVAGMTEAEKLMAEAEARGEVKATERYAPRLRQLILTSAAQGKLVEPEVAANLIGADIDIDDPKEVAAAIDAVVKKYPGLSVQEEGPQRHSGGTFEQGPRGTNVQTKRSMNDLLMENLGLKNGKL